MISMSPHRRMMVIDGLNAVWMMHAGRLGVAGDWWDPTGAGLCVWAAYQAKGVASLAASYIDLSGNGNNAGDPGGVNTPAWDIVNGWKFDGGNDYLTTTFVPQIDQSQSVIVQLTNSIDADWLCGSWTGVANAALGLVPRGATTPLYYFNGGNSNVAPGLAAGNLCVAGTSGYRNGAAEGAAIGGYVGPPTIPLYIGCRNNKGVADRPCAVYIQAFAIYDCALTAPQVAVIAAAMATL